jgi:hypothetical protein
VEVHCRIICLKKSRKKEAGKSPAYLNPVNPVNPVEKNLDKLHFVLYIHKTIKYAL